MTGTIAVIVPSFNRPRLLREALASIVGADQVIVADDGSDFDVMQVVYDFRDRWEPLVLHPVEKLSPQKRMRTPSCGRLINTALRRVTADYVTYLCDDDLFAPDWLPAAVAHLDAKPQSHMVRGDWLKFNDGETLETAVPCVFDIDPELTTGNFAHRTSCTSECGCLWAEWTVSCHDYSFIDTYLRKHGSRDIAHAGVLAGYRREHEFNMLRWMGQSNDYKPETLALFEAGLLEAAR